MTDKYPIAIYFKGVYTKTHPLVDLRRGFVRHIQFQRTGEMSYKFQGMLYDMVNKQLSTIQWTLAPSRHFDFTYAEDITECAGGGARESSSTCEASADGAQANQLIPLGMYSGIQP